MWLSWAQVKNKPYALILSEVGLFLLWCIHSSKRSLCAGPKVVLFLHGFPEIWYSWRHQMLAAAAAGYRAIAFDFRGYGLSQQPPEPGKASFDDLVVDTIGVMDSLGISKVLIFKAEFSVSLSLDL